MTEENLRDLVCTLGKLEPGQLGAETLLASVIRNSLGMAKLSASIRSRFSISNPEIYKAATYGELCAVLGIENSSILATTRPPVSAVETVEVRRAAGPIGVGVDVESIAAMPERADYWEDDFYKKTFTAREIAYASLQASPRASFTAMWCAKEALRKADSSLIMTDWKILEVNHDADGKPSITKDGQQVSGSLSVSHTDEIALAVFVGAPHVDSAAPASADQVTPQPVLEGHDRGNRTATLIAVFALLVSVAAVAAMFLRQ